MSRFTLCGVVGLVISISGSVNAQDGRIIDERPLTPDESLRKEIESRAEFTSAFKAAADVVAVVNQVDMGEITYASDGLKVKGFVIAPKKAGRYPVLIWNRGGEMARPVCELGLCRGCQPIPWLGRERRK